METVEINIERRSGSGKGAARKLRSAGRVPAILYGPKRSAAQISVQTEQFERRLVHLEGSQLIRLVHTDGGDAELHERMRKGLSMTAVADLLLLCAWCYAYRDEHDDARFVYRQAKEREGSHRLDVAMPKLAAWIDEYRKEHPDLDQPDADE